MVWLLIILASRTIDDEKRGEIEARDVERADYQGSTVANQANTTNRGFNLNLNKIFQTGAKCFSGGWIVGAQSNDRVRRLLLCLGRGEKCVSPNSYDV